MPLAAATRRNALSVHAGEPAASCSSSLHPSDSSSQRPLSCHDMVSLHDSDYRRLLEFRDGIRRFLRWSEGEAAAVGLTAAQHQLLLAVRGHGTGRDPTIGE